jgi:uncharacterized protein YciI
MYDPNRKEQCYICLIRKVDNPPPLPLPEDEFHLLHRAFVQSLSDRKLLVSSGPARDGDGTVHHGSIIILRARTQADAERIIGEDPNISHGQRRAEYTPWLRMWFEDDPPAKKA